MILFDVTCSLSLYPNSPIPLDSQVNKMRGVDYEWCIDLSC